jgi:hypothetical protein
VDTLQHNHCFNSNTRLFNIYSLLWVHRLMVQLLYGKFAGLTRESISASFAVQRFQRQVSPRCTNLRSTPPSKFCPESSNLIVTSVEYRGFFVESIEERTPGLVWNDDPPTPGDCVTERSRSPSARRLPSVIYRMPGEKFPAASHSTLQQFR